MAKARTPDTPDRSAVKTRQEAKQETRVALIEAGVAAFAAEGLDASLDSICARAGYTRGAFYVHFKDRDDFLLAVMDDIFQRFLDEVIATGDAALDLERTIELFSGAVERGVFPMKGGIPLHQFLAACARSLEIRTRYVQVLQEAVRRLVIAVKEGQEAGTVRSDISPEHTASLLTAIALGVQSMLEIEFPIDVRPAASDVSRVLKPESTK